MNAPKPTDADINARIAEISETAELSTQSGDATFFEAQWVNLDATEKREYVITELSGEN